jgi:DNA-binding IclR family transcriptional regulator
VLELLAAAGGRAALSDLAQMAQLSRSTTHRLLTTLLDTGYVTQDRHSRYVLGNRLLGLGIVVRSRTASLREAAKPSMELLAQSTGETVNLVTLDGPLATYIDQVEGSKALRVAFHVGSRFPSRTSASARAILAFQHSPKLIDAAFTQSRPERLAERTIETLEAFRAEVEATRLRGFAIEQDELEDGISCIAAPILGPPDDLAVAAISIAGPTSRILSPTPERLGSLVMAFAAEITRQNIDAKLTPRASKTIAPTS